MAVEYFSKWIEAKPVTNNTVPTMKKFFWQNIVCRFGVPHELVMDNTKNFDNEILREYCHNLGMKMDFASIYCLQSKGVVEKANSVIFKAVKKNPGKSKEGKLG